MKDLEFHYHLHNMNLIQLTSELHNIRRAIATNSAYPCSLKAVLYAIKYIQAGNKLVPSK